MFSYNIHNTRLRNTKNANALEIMLYKFFTCMQVQTLNKTVINLDTLQSFFTLRSILRNDVWKKVIVLGRANFKYNMMQTSTQIPPLDYHKCKLEHLPINWIARRLQMGLLLSQLIFLGKNYVYILIVQKHFRWVFS